MFPAPVQRLLRGVALAGKYLRQAYTFSRESRHARVVSVGTVFFVDISTGTTYTLRAAMMWTTGAGPQRH